MDPRESKLPVWVQQLIANLRLRIDNVCDPFVREITKLQPRLKLLEARNSALIELLECAARGGHKTAQEIMAIIGAYDLTLTKLEE